MLQVVTSAFVKKKNSKIRHLKKFINPMEVNGTCIGFTEFVGCLIFDSGIVTTSAFVKKERSKLRHLKKSVKTMGVKLKNKMSH